MEHRRPCIGKGGGRGNGRAGRRSVPVRGLRGREPLDPRRGAGRAERDPARAPRRRVEPAVSRTRRVALVAGCVAAAAAAGAGAVVVTRRMRAARRRELPPLQPEEPAPLSAVVPVVDAPVVAAGHDRRDAPAPRPRGGRPNGVAVIAAVVVTLAASAGAAAVVAVRRDSGGGGGRAEPPAILPESTAAAPVAAPFEGWVDPASAGRPYVGATIPGVLTFR